MIKHHKRRWSYKTNGLVRDANRWRERQEDWRYRAEQHTRNGQGDRRAALEWWLENKPLRSALENVLYSTFLKHLNVPSYDIVDAFVDILTTLKPDCDAALDARWVASSAGLPVETLRTRQDFDSWFKREEPVPPAPLIGMSVRPTPKPQSVQGVQPPRGDEPIPATP